MLTTFFHDLRAAKVPVTLKEYLTLMEALTASLDVSRTEAGTTVRMTRSLREGEG